MSDEHPKVVIIPCSGIGKSFGTVSRMAAFLVTERDLPEQTCLVPLALLVMGDEASRKIVAESKAIAIDGCKLACATKMVLQSGGQIEQSFAVLEAYRRRREFKPEGIAELNKGGEQLADALAREIDEVVGEVIKREGDSHA